MVVSLDADASMLVSGLKATDVTWPRWYCDGTEANHISTAQHGTARRYRRHGGLVQRVSATGT
jgi:hypothetical protein